MEKSSGIHACLGPTDLVGIVVKSEEIWFGLVMSPTFMLGIWHGGDWLKETFGSANIWSSNSWKPHTWFSFSFINKSSFSLVFHV